MPLKLTLAAADNQYTYQYDLNGGVNHLIYITLPFAKLSSEFELNTSSDDIPGRNSQMLGTNLIDLSNVEQTNRDLLVTTDAIDSSSDDEVFLCVFYRRNKLAAAVYNAETSELQLMYDVSDLAPDYRLLNILFLQINPSKIVTCSSLSDLFLRKVHSLVTGEEVTISPTVEVPSFSEKLHLISAKEFKYTTCKRSILELRLPTEPENASECERHNYIMSVINLSAPGLVSAVGGLLYFLQRSLGRLTLSTVETPVLSIRNLSLKDQVWVDNETIHALQIFSPIVHPSSYKWFSGGSKEGLSIFSLLNRCYSTSGAKYMRVILSQPTRNIEVLQTRHEVISFCLMPINEPIVKSISDSIVHIKPVMIILTKMTNAQASVAQWKALYDTIYNAVVVGEVCKSHVKDVKFFEEIADCLVDSIFIMSHCINRIMDFEASTLQNRFVVKFGVCDELDELKERHSNLSGIMAKVAEEELLQLPEFIESCSMVYIPEVGYLLAIPFWEPALTDEQIKSLPNLQYKFKSKNVIHYKSARCLELDDLLGDVQLKVIEIESKIVLKLVQYIQRNATPLVYLTNLIAELDCLLALALVARDYNLVKPTLTEGKEICIIKGRHILQELCVGIFVPNDTRCNREHGFVKILSGPNASGKSVYLKQVALIAFLAHVGSFIPAETATIGVLDQIHTRIQTIESVNDQLSAFMIDLRQMALSIRNSNSNSLIIIDEFGKGTSEVDGLGILVACLEHFIAREYDSPHLFVSTHFHSLPKMLPSSPILQYQHLEHIVDKGELVYLYRLKDGSVQSSFAIQVAESQGLSKPLAQRAMQILNDLRESEHITADISNKSTQISKKRKLFLKELSMAELSTDMLNKWKKELIDLRL